MMFCIAFVLSFVLFFVHVVCGCTLCIVLHTLLFCVDLVAPRVMQCTHICFAVAQFLFFVR